MTASVVHGYTVYEPEYYTRSKFYLSDAWYRYFWYLTDGYAVTVHVDLSITSAKNVSKQEILRH